MTVINIEDYKKQNTAEEVVDCLVYFDEKGNRKAIPIYVLELVANGELKFSELPDSDDIGAELIYALLEYI